MDRSTGLYTGRVQTWFSLCMVSLYIYRTGTGVDVVFVEFHSTCKYRMGTEVDVVLVEDQGMYIMGTDVDVACGKYWGMYRRARTWMQSGKSISINIGWVRTCLKSWYNIIEYSRLVQR